MYQNIVMRKEISMNNKIIYSPWLEYFPNGDYVNFGNEKNKGLAICSHGLNEWFKFSGNEIRFYMSSVPTHLTYRIQRVEINYTSHVIVNYNWIVVFKSFAAWLDEIITKNKDHIYIGLEYR